MRGFYQVKRPRPRGEGASVPANFIAARLSGSRATAIMARERHWAKLRPLHGEELPTTGQQPGCKQLRRASRKLSPQAHKIGVPGEKGKPETKA